MAFKFYTVPIQDFAAAAAELNGFLSVCSGLYSGVATAAEVCHPLDGTARSP